MLDQESDVPVPSFQPTDQSTEEEHKSWSDYWQEQGYLWRTEAEITEKRKTFLAECLCVVPDIKQGIYPFKDIRLSRADIEWLLATHQDGRGPVEWHDPMQHLRVGLDLRGANLIGVDLHALPLSRIHAGLTETERTDTTAKQRAMAAVQLQGANLFEAHLEGAFLAGAKLEGADLSRAHFEQASLMYAHLEGANLRTAHLEGAFLGFAQCNGKLMEEHELHHIRQWKDDFPARVAPANWRHVFFDRATNLDSINLGDAVHGFVSMVDVNWGEANLAMVNWEKIPMLGDEYKILQRTKLADAKHEANEQLRDYRRAARANRQLAIALQEQGLNEEAARFAYRAQVLQRGVFLRRARYGQYLFSLFLDLLAGYGYKLRNSFFAYVLVIAGFATAYFVLGPKVGLHLSPLEAFVFSMTSFHGRGFSPGQNIGLANPLTVLAALEAFVGLIIEITFIATMTQRFFRR